jgi:hypothetical protein
MPPKRHDPRRSSAGYRNRWTDTRELRQRFLIVCEGARSEPNYFEAFRVNRRVVRVDVRGTGYNTVSLVKRALEIRGEEGYTEPYDQVWCVFDRDAFPTDDFDDAIWLARSKGVNTAYSNECFELWYVLHFQYMDSAFNRDVLASRLSELLGRRYAKNSPDMYGELLARQATAIANAERLFQQYGHRSPAAENPSTTVHLLVEELNRFLV